MKACHLLGSNQVVVNVTNMMSDPDGELLSMHRQEEHRGARH